MRKPFIAGNWKMNKTIGEACSLANELKRELADIDSCDIAICPPFTALSAVNDIISSSNIALGAQNLFWEKEGAFTGEISPAMIKDCGCKYVIIGHSERRKYFSESGEIINKKINAAIDNNLFPIICVGETLSQRENNETFSVIERQLKEAFENIAQQRLKDAIIAYEPVWAIGTGKTATPQTAQEVHEFIRQKIAQYYSADFAQQLRLLYGGSVKPDNISDLMKQKDIDGALVGGASLKASSFSEIVKRSI